MPWDEANFPASMRHLGAAARAKAKEWAQGHGLPVRDDDRPF
ncbi:hypothetical protein V4F39_21960 [Aquincola sp. MAHUQ-54]|uniref:Uncharacterized protein n=1 Tax=Aquincola agrisoli TaxID=3119538 RepID=A0AAW9QH31_9BURK